MAEANLIVKIGGLLDSSLDRATRTAVSRIQSLGSQLSSIGSSFSLGITAPLAAFGAAAINAGKEIESLKLALKSIEGSAAGAERRFRELQEVAKLPGLGVREAVQADLALRAYGLTAERAKTVTLAFGNALASAGRGKADLAETVRQFGQLSAAGKLTAENLKPISERVPQVAAILRESFGTATAEGLRDLGLSSQQVIDVLIAGLQKIPPITGGLKNSLENFSDAAERSLAKVGDALTPFVSRFLSEFAEPLLKKIEDIATGFQKLPSSTQNAIVAFTALAAVSGPVLLALGSIAGAITNIVVLAGKLKAAEGLFTALSVSIRALPFAALAAGAGYVLDKLLETKTAQDNLTRANRQQADSLDYLKDKYRQQQEQIGYLIPGQTTLKDRVFEFAANLKASGTEAEKSTPKVKGLATGLQGVATQTEKIRAIRFEDRSLLNAVIAQESAGAVSKTVSRLVELRAEIERLATTGDKPIISEEPILRARESTRELIEEISQLPGYARLTEEAWARVGLEIGRIRVPPELREFEGRIFREANDAVKKGAKDFEKAQKEQERSARDAQRHIERYFHRTAQAIGDVIFSAKSAGQAITQFGREILKSLATAAIEAQLKRLTKVFLDFGASLGATGIGKVLGGIFGADLSKNAGGLIIKNATGAAASAASGAASAATSAAISSVTGIVTAVSSAVTAISSVVSNFQFAAMNKSLDLIEKEVRYSQIHLLHILENSNKYWPWIQYAHDRLKQLVDGGIGVYNAPGWGPVQVSGAATGSGGGPTITIDLRGSTFGGGTTREAVEEMFEQAARRLVLAGAVAG